MGIRPDHLAKLVVYRNKLIPFRDSVSVGEAGWAFSGGALPPPVVTFPDLFTTGLWNKPPNLAWSFSRVLGRWLAAAPLDSEELRA